jgi:DNA-binding transcriptional LysR family regulator
MARELVERAKAFAEHARHSDHGMMNGTLRIGCETSQAKYVLPHLIGEFHQRFPQAHISCTKISHTSTEEKLASREIQLGVVARPINAPDLASWQLFSDELILVVGPHHPWSHRQTISLDELRETDLILTQEGASCLVNHEISPPETHSVLNLKDTKAALSAIQVHQGVALVSRLAARGYLAHNRVRRIHINPTACLTFHVSLAYQSISCDGLARQFNEFIQSSTGRCLIARHTVGEPRQ